MTLGVLQCLADACVPRFTEKGTAVVGYSINSARGWHIRDITEDCVRPVSQDVGSGGPGQVTVQRSGESACCLEKNDVTLFR